MESRCKVVHIEAVLIAALLRPGRSGAPTLTVIDGVPDDAQYVRCDYDFDSDCFRFLFSHPDWDPIPVGGQFPRLSPLLHIQAPEEVPDAPS